MNTYGNLGSLAGKMTVVYGNKSSTSSPTAYQLGSRASIDYITGDYVDGRPVKSLLGPGDYLVPTVSSIIGANVLELPLDHGELIYSKTAIKSILDALAIPYQNTDVVEGSATQISTSMLIAIQSPVEASVQIGSQTYNSEEGIVFIPNAQSGNYTLNVKKLAPGDYTVTVAQISQQNDVWEQLTGTIEESKVGEEDNYEINYDNRKATPQINTKKCSKYRRGTFNIRRKFNCKIKNYHEDR